MTPRRRMLLVWCFGLMLAACGGGSGSTGLITSEDAVIDDVRRSGTCGEFDGAPYCATDSANATAPGGQTASVVAPAGPTPARTASPAPPTPAATSAASPTSAASASPGGATATPQSFPTVTPTPSPATSVTIAVSGFRSGSVCATAARPLGSDEAWRTGAPVAVDASGAAVAYPLPSGVAAPLDLTLLCFDPPPAALAPQLTTLADASPTVVFVLPSP